MHRFEAFESDNRFFLNPGSATGAFSPLWTPPPPPPSAPAIASPSKETPSHSESTTDKDETATSSDKETTTSTTAPPPPASSSEEDESLNSPTPSFALLDIQGNVVVTYVYTEKNGDVSVEKMEFRKHVS